MLIEILGTSFQIKTDQTPEYVDSLVQYYKKKLSEAKNTLNTHDPLILSVITGILLSDEIANLKNQNDDNQLSEIKKITSLIIEKIDKTLYDNT